MRAAAQAAAACRDGLFELEYRSGARWTPLPPQRPTRVYLETPTALGELGVGSLYAKDAAAPIEVGEIADLQALPGAIVHPGRQHGVEDQAAGSRERKCPLLRRQAVHWGAARLQIAAATPEALRAEVVRHTSLPDRRKTRREPSGEFRAIPLRHADTYGKAIACECATGQLACMRVGLEHLEVGGSQRVPVDGPARPRQ